MLRGGSPPLDQKADYDFLASPDGGYFSILSALRIGWSGLNFGTWISRIQPYEYELHATGWVRVVSGVQSLISVYLVALAILTYFGAPFEYYMIHLCSLQRLEADSCFLRIEQTVDRCELAMRVNLRPVGRVITLKAGVGDRRESKRVLIGVCDVPRLWR